MYYRTIPILTSAWALISSLTLFSLPKEAQVISGDAKMHFPRNDHLQVHTSHQAIIHWKEFSIGQQEQVQFVQPSSHSSVLNRVKGSDPSHLLGQLNANGRVYLINPHGVIFGKDCVIRTAEFTASTHDLLDTDFLLDQDLLFQGDSSAAIINYGTIHAEEGNIILIARIVDNQGELSAPQGTASLAAGQEIFLKLQDTPILTIRPSLSQEGTLTHSGQIKALVAELQAEGQAHSRGINIEGSVLALNTVTENGKIYLKADSIDIAPQGKLEGSAISLETSGRLYHEGILTAKQGSIRIKNSSEEAPFYNLGLLDASGPQGGEIHIETPKLLQSGKIRADGTATSGGTITIQTHGPYIEMHQGLLSTDGVTEGGVITVHADTSLYSSGTHLSRGEEGGEIALLSPQLTLVSSHLDATGVHHGGDIFIGEPSLTQKVRLGGDSHLTASATAGDGGTIVIWSEQETIAHGSLCADAGPNGEYGGWIEVSSAGDLYCAATLSAHAPRGSAGTVLLDPKNIIIDALLGVYPQYEFIDPNSGGGTNFGTSVSLLSTGNVVITKPNDNFGGANAGAVYLYNGLTAALLSTLTGGTANSLVGNNGVTLLTNGNYVIKSPNWDDGGITDAGAVTWGSASTGVNGVVSAANSLVGSSTNDRVGFNGVVVLSNGNYIVNTSTWSDGALSSVGAVTWGDGTTGISGVVSAVNSLVGSTANDSVGSAGVVALTNGNYVVTSPIWDNGGTANAGAVTWANGLTGISGTISATNSLVGGTANNNVGSNGVTALTNGNYVVKSPNWDDGAVTNVGAATWGDGTIGISGTVSSSNSLVGSTALDRVGFSVTALTNGHYVVASQNWANGPVSNAGAATWGNGTTGITGTVSSTNSLVGTTTNDVVSSGSVVVLANSNYVVISPAWNDGVVTDVGAVTWSDGTMGITGTVSSSNSLVGSTASDAVGSNIAIALTNGNYVVVTPLWNDGAISDAGAVTWGNGLMGIAGVVSSTNSLVGSAASDVVGNQGVIALTNGNYLVSSSEWDNGVVASAGAATWGDGTTGISGTISSTNSLVGTAANDRVGNIGGKALTNGNYVVISSVWNDGVVTAVGAVTWGNGATGTSGTVSSGNSLVGSTINDQIGTTVAALVNGNYVVGSSGWDNGVVVNAGASTWGNGATGISGTISSANSLVGTMANDSVGAFLASALTNGDYVVLNPVWDNGAFVNAGAATWGNGLTGITGPITSQNSIVGQAANTGLQTPALDDTVNGTFIVRFLAEGSGRVRAGIYTPTQMSFQRAQEQTMTITPSFVTETLNTGTAVTLQANNDLTISSAISCTPGAGALTLRAGRSVLIDADITSGNALLRVVANDLLASGVVDAFREPGDAVLSVANGVTLNTGAGNLILSLLNGGNKTNAESGNLTIGDSAILQCSGSGSMTLTAQGHSIVLTNGALLQTVNGTIRLSAGQDISAVDPVTLQTTGTGELILITDALFPSPPTFGTGKADFPQAGLTTAGGRLLIYTSQRALNTLPATINGVPYVPGPLFVDSTTEKWATYYPNSSGIPFTVFYKDGQSTAPSGSSPAFAQASHAMITAVVGPFQSWANPWFDNAFFTVDPYPPYLTPKILPLKLPSLVHEPEKE